MKLIDGDYQIDLELSMDRGHGIEGTSYCVVIYVLDGHIDEVIAYGYHDITETDFDCNPYLDDSQCIDLLKKHHPNAFQDYTTDELLDMDAEAKLDLYKDDEGA